MNLIAGGVRLIDLVHAVIVLTVLEGLLLALYRWRSGRGVALGDFGVNLLSGLCLMLALRAAVLDAGWQGILVWLAASGIAHTFDLWRRWQR